MCNPNCGTLDASPDHDDVTITSPADLVPGKFSTGVHTSCPPGANFQVQGPDTGFPSGDGPITIEASVESGVANSELYVLGYGGGGVRRFFLSSGFPAALGVLEWVVDPTVDCHTAPVFPYDGNFHHLAATYSGGQARIYFDGVQVKACTVNALTTASNGFFGVGDDCAGGFSSDSVIDELRVLDYAASPAQIASDSVAANPLDAIAGTVGLWHFDAAASQYCCPSGSSCGAPDVCDVPSAPICPTGETLCAGAACCPSGSTCTSGGQCVVAATPLPPPNCPVPCLDSDGGCCAVGETCGSNSTCTSSSQPVSFASGADAATNPAGASCGVGYCCTAGETCAGVPSQGPGTCCATATPELCGNGCCPTAAGCSASSCGASFCPPDFPVGCGAECCGKGACEAGACACPSDHPVVCGDECCSAGSGCDAGHCVNGGPSSDGGSTYDCCDEHCHPAWQPGECQPDPTSQMSNVNGCGKVMLCKHTSSNPATDYYFCCAGWEVNERFFPGDAMACPNGGSCFNDCDYNVPKVWTAACEFCCEGDPNQTTPDPNYCVNSCE